MALITNYKKFKIVSFKTHSEITCPVTDEVVTLQTVDLQLIMSHIDYWLKMDE